MTATPTNLLPSLVATFCWTELAVWSEVNLIFSPFSKVLSSLHFSKKSDLAELVLSLALLARLIVAKKATRQCFMASSDLSLSLFLKY